MDVTHIDNGVLLTIPAHSNVSAIKMKEELSKLHPNKSFAIADDKTVVAHIAGEVDQFKPKTPEAWFTMMDILGVSYQVKGRAPCLDRDCNVIQVEVGSDIYNLGVDDKEQLVFVTRSVTLFSEAVKEDYPLTSISEKLLFPFNITDSGEIDETIRNSEPSLWLACETAEHARHFVECWNRKVVSDATGGSFHMQLAMVDGKIVVLPLGMKVTDKLYITDWTLFNPNDCGNSVQSQFDNACFPLERA